MLREDVYMRTSSEFGTPVGVANIIGTKTKEDSIEELGEKGYKILESDLELNNIIKEAIYRGKYKELFRKVWELEKVMSSRTKELTIWKTAWKDVK